MATRINFGDVDDSLQKLADLAGAIESIKPRDLVKALEFGAQEAEGIAQDFAVKNFGRSGVKSRSGDLLSAVSNSKLALIAGGGGASLLRFSLEPKLSKEFYIRANAVEYGAIRSPEGRQGTLKSVRNIPDTGRNVQLHRNIGKRRRSALKKKLQGKIDKGSRAQKIAGGLTLDTGTVTVTESGSVSGQTSLGKVTVTKAHNYFKLSAPQMKTVINEVVSEAWFYLENLIGRKAK
jgi:hypothetical protein